MRFIDCIDIVGERPKQFIGQKRYVSTGALDVDYIKEKDIELVTYKNRPSRADLQAQPDDLLFAKMADTKKTLVLDENTAENIYSTGFYAVRAKKDIITTKCLYYLVSSNLFLTQKDKNSSGATQRAITNKGLECIEINIPTLLEQKNLTDTLDRLSDIIKNRQRQLEKMDNLIKARFVEMFGDPIDNRMGWNTLALSSICTIIVDCPHSTPNYTLKDTGFRCIRTSIVKKNRILWDDIEFISEEEFKQRIKRKKPTLGDIVYTREGAILGIAAIIDRDYDVALGQRSMLLSSNRDICNPVFLCTAMNFDSFLLKALKGISGSASPHINVADIKSFEMIVPKIELQNQFATFVEQVDKSKFNTLSWFKTKSLIH